MGTSVAPGRPCLGAYLEHLHFAEGESLGEAQVEVDPVRVFFQVLQHQLHREAG